MVSRSSAKYRLIEVGLETAIAQFEDYTDVYAEILESKDYQPLSPIEAFSLASEDPLLSEWISSGSFIYADGYFVLASPKFVAFKAGVPRLTITAKKNLQRCVLNIREQRFADYTNACKDFEGLCYLYKTNVEAQDVDKRIYLLIRNCKRTSRNLTLTNPILRHTSRYLRMMKTKKTSYWECLECRAKHYASAYGFLWRTGIGPHPPHLWNTQDCTQTIMVKSKMTPTIIWGLMFLWRFA